MRRESTIAFVLAGAVSIIPFTADGATISVILTDSALEIHSTPQNDNDGKTVDMDVADKLITSPTIGQGSILYIQSDGKAGQTDLFATITGLTHLANTSFPAGVASPNDIQAGIIYLTKGDAPTNTVKDNGLGIKAFTVDSTTGIRTTDSKTDLAKIEGSKEISGGSDAALWDGNGAPHVDELALIDFNYTNVQASSVSATLTKFESTDKAWIHIDLIGGGSKELTYAGPSDISGSSYDSKDKVWTFAFGAAEFGLSSTDLIKDFYVRAVDTSGGTKTTAEHFLLNGFTADTVPVPTPGIVPLPAPVWGGGVLLALLASLRLRAARRRAREPG